MDVLKSCKAVQTLDAKIYKICTDVNAIVKNILKWGEEVEEIVEREFSTENNMSTFLLPKTLSEKKLRKTKKTLVHKKSKANTTLAMNDTSDLNSTRTTRTRAASRALKLKMSQLPYNCIPSDQNDAGVPLNETLKKGNIDITLSNDTFIVPNATSTRTKPVVKKKQSPEASNVENILKEGSSEKPSNVTNEVSDGGSSSCPEQRQSRDKILENRDETPRQRESRSLFSRTFSEGPVTRSGKSKPPEEPNSSAGEGSVRKKVSRALSESPVNRPTKISKSQANAVDEFMNGIESAQMVDKSQEESMFRAYRTSIQSPIMRSSKTIAPETPSGSPRLRSSSIRPIRTSSKSPAITISRNEGPPIKSEDPTESLEHTFTEKTVSIERERTPESAHTYVLDGVGNAEEGDEGKTPGPSGATFTRYSQKTSTPVADKEKTLLFEGEEIECLDGKMEKDEIVDESEEERNLVPSDCKNSHSSFGSTKKEKSEGESMENPMGKKKKRSKKKELVDELPLPDTGRITRTKSKAIKDMLKDAEANANESTNQHQDFSAFAKKLLKKAKMNSQKKNQLVAVLESNGTPKNPHQANYPPGVLTSKSKYKLLLSSSKKLKTPLATLPNSSVKRPKPSDQKNRFKNKIAKRDSSVENLIGSATKPLRGIEDEVKLKTRKKKEDEVAKKRQKVIKQKQEELRRKNELKQQLVMKQRERLEQEKYNNMIQTEKEKEERHKLILQERQMKMKEEALKKKMLTQQKMAETIERRKMEEKARLAKLKEMEAEEQRLALEKQREQEEKLAQEQLAMKKAREEQEWLLKQEIELEKWKLKAEKMAAAGGSASKKFLPSGSKMQNWNKKPEKKKEWDYKPRSENDYGLEDEDEDWDMDGQDERVKSNKRTPAWSTRVLNCKCPRMNVLTIEMVSEYMPCHQKTPDIHKMFGMTPTKRIKRTSSAIWNTPNSLS